MRKTDNHEEPLLPFPVAPVSNGEWCPPPITDRQVKLGELIIEETGKRAKMHGMSRGQFLRTAAATMTAFWCMNKAYGYDQTGDNAMLPVRKEHCDDLDAAREVLDRKEWFIMDVQQHHVDLDLFANAGPLVCFLDFARNIFPTTIPCPESIGQFQYVKEIFINSQTNVGVISGLPNGLPLGPAAMAQTRDLVNELAGSERALSQAVCDPRTNPNAPTSIENMAHQVENLQGRALKCYTYSDGGWRLDDANGTRMLQKATELGITLVNTHKGFPSLALAPSSPQTVRTIDYPQALRNFPKMKFCAYHSGYFPGNSHPEGSRTNDEFISVLEGLTRKERSRMYAEIGTTFATTFLFDEDERLSNVPEAQRQYRTAHLLGRLLKTLGSRNVIWGTDCVWWGSPQWLIDAFKLMEMPASLQEDFGYPALTEKVKRRIFGLNAAKLYGVKPKAERCTVPLDRLEQLQVAQGGARAGGTLRWYGPQTRRGFFSLLRGEWRPRV